MNETEVTERASSWNWTGSSKVALSVVEKTPGSERDVTKGISVIHVRVVQRFKMKRIAYCQHEIGTYRVLGREQFRRSQIRFRRNPFRCKWIHLWVCRTPWVCQSPCSRRSNWLILSSLGETSTSDSCLPSSRKSIRTRQPTPLSHSSPHGSHG